MAFKILSKLRNFAQSGHTAKDVINYKSEPCVISAANGQTDIGIIRSDVLFLIR